MCPIETLGERIRKLRKQQKFTLEALAGNELTKGMLSLIENNKANPSMESLSYIAGRLGIDVSELLEEISNQELNELLTKVDKLYYAKVEKKEQKWEQIIALIQPYASKLNNGYEAARLLDLYGRALHHREIDEWQFYLEKAASLYEQMNIAHNRANIGIFRSFIHGEKHDYENALRIFQFERTEIEKKCIFIDPMTRLDLDYTEVTLLFAVGKSEEALRLMESGINFSKEQQILYRIEPLYRLATFHAMMTGEQEKIDYYTKKIELYGVLTNDKQSLLFVQTVKIHYLTTYQHAYEKALALLEEYYPQSPTDNIHKNFYHAEKGRIFFGLKEFENAMEQFTKVKVLDYSNHPFDLSIFYEIDAYRALCYREFGDHDNAFFHAKLAYDNILPMPNSPYKEFIIETYEKIRSRQ